MTAKDVSKECSSVHNALGTAGEICVLVKYSPKRENLLGDIQKSIEFADETSDNNIVTLDKLCPTRWTVRAECYKKILEAYEPLFDLWELSLEKGKLDTDVKSRIIGCQAQMKKFDFLGGLNLGYKFYSLTDNLSRALQSKKMSAVSGQRLARQTMSMFEKMRNDRDAKLLFDLVKQNASKITRIKEPALGRQKNTPRYATINFSCCLPS